MSDYISKSGNFINSFLDPVWELIIQHHVFLLKAEIYFLIRKKEKQE